MTSRARELAIGLVAVAVVALVILAAGTVALQGWRSRAPGLDAIPSIVGAHDLVDRGRIPDRGVLTSYLSYVPPGGAWLFVPGVMLFEDPRLAEFPGAILLTAGTLIGVFVLARRYFGFPGALLAVVLYGLSPIGVWYTATVGPRGHPCFFVWMVYLACEWASADVRSDETSPAAMGTRRRDAASWFLAAAIAAWAFGMLLFPGLAPAVVLLPVIWWRSRPEVRVRPIGIVLALLLVVWLPYLRFESARGYLDLKSQFLRQTLHPIASSENPLLCNSSIEFEWAAAGAPETGADDQSAIPRSAGS